MTIDEAIAKYKEITNTDAVCPAHCNIPCEKCVQESEQLVDWLEELKANRIALEKANGYLEANYKLGYNKAIDDCKELTFREVVYYDSLNDRTEFRELAEQLKADDTNE